MIEPALDRLLGGIAASLEASVLPELAAAPLARRQAREAIRILRRIAAAADALAPALEADNADMEAVLRAILPLLPVRHPAHAEIDGPIGTPRDRNLHLQQALVLADAAAHDLPQPQRAEALSQLRALYRRMLAREQALNRPPETAHLNGKPA